MAELKVYPNKRYTFIGKTRSGKSFLAWFLLRQFAKSDEKLQIVFIDPKHEHRAFGDGTKFDAPKLVKKYDSKIRYMLFQEYEWNGELDKMVDGVLSRGNAIVVLDELGGLASATSVPTGITRLWTQGGGKGVGAWAMLQFPKRTPKVIKSQSELFFMFRITALEDRKDMLSYIPDSRILAKPLDKYYFWIYSDDMDKAIKIAPIKASSSNKHK